MPPVADAVPAVALLILLVTDYPRGRWEAAIGVVGDVCGRSGVFAAAAGLVRGLGRDHPMPLFTGVFLLAALVTTVLSLDATAAVVLAVWALPNGHLTIQQAVHAGHPAFAVFVLCLGVVVAALVTH